MSPLRQALARPGVRSGEEVVQFRVGDVWHQARFDGPRMVMRDRRPDGQLSPWRDDLIDGDAVEDVTLAAREYADHSLRKAGHPGMIEEERALIEALDAVLALPEHAGVALMDKVRCLLTVMIGRCVESNLPAQALAMCDGYFHTALRNGARSAGIGVVTSMEELEAHLAGRRGDEDPDPKPGAN